MLNTCTDLKQIKAASHNKSAVRKGNSEEVMPGFGYGDTLLGNRLLGLQKNARPPRLSAIPLALDQISKQAKRNNLATFVLEEHRYTHTACTCVAGIRSFNAQEGRKQKAWRAEE